MKNLYLVMICMLFVILPTTGCLMMLVEPDVGLTCLQSSDGKLVFTVRSNVRVNCTDEIGLWEPGESNYLWKLDVRGIETRSFSLTYEEPASVSPYRQIYPENGNPLPLEVGQTYSFYIIYGYDGFMAPSIGHEVFGVSIEPEGKVKVIPGFRPEYPESIVVGLEQDLHQSQRPVPDSRHDPLDKEEQYQED